MTDPTLPLLPLLEVALNDSRGYTHRDQNHSRTTHQNSVISELPTKCRSTSNETKWSEDKRVVEHRKVKAKVLCCEFICMPYRIQYLFQMCSTKLSFKENWSYSSNIGLYSPAGFFAHTISAISATPFSIHSLFINLNCFWIQCSSINIWLPIAALLHWTVRFYIHQGAKSYYL